MLCKYEYRRRLPHYQSDYKALFVTFNTYCRWTLPESARAIVFEACLYANQKRFILHGLVVMPDHVHLVLTPFADENGTFSLAEIMQGIKGASAHRINQLLGRRGYVWQQESFDGVLRREESIGDKVDHMLGNPVRAGLVNLPWEYPWLWPRQVQPVAIQASM
jgi:putative transposase